MPVRQLIIRGAKQNNLKDVSLTLPHDCVIAVTGVSGSGKSSLAFDTIFAEGQWRFIESLSTYARLFLEKLDRPNVDAIENIRPAIALEQRNPVRGARSTVGTLTELYDFFRILFARTGTPICPSCGEEIVSWDASAIVQELLAHYPDRRAFVMFDSRSPLSDLARRGFLRVMAGGGGGEAMDIDEALRKGAPVGEVARVVLDRLVIRDEPRLGDSIEAAFAEGEGRVIVRIVDGPDMVFTSGTNCDSCGGGVAEPTPLLFSFNHPVGACPECKGFGNVLRYSEDLVVPDPHLSLSRGAIEPWEKPAARWWKSQMMKGAKKAGLNTATPYRDLPPQQKELLRTGSPHFHGIEDFFEDLEGKRYKLHVRVFLARYRSGVVCPVCKGKRLRPEALAYRIGERDIADLSALTIGELEPLMQDLPLSPMKRETARELLRQIGLKLAFLNRVGLHYLSLDREAKTLSGGEYQRVNLSNQLSANLTGTLYVLDEPTVGLHARDTDRISGIMGALAVAGNTVVVVEHDRSIIERADWVVELGPGGGDLGGSVVFSGPMDEFRKAATATANYLREGLPTAGGKRKRRALRAWLTLRGCRGHNLKDIDASIPLGALTVVTGVSGSGKSTLVVDTLYPALRRELRLGHDTPLPMASIEGTEWLKAVKLIDQGPIGRSPRSNPVTYLKLFDVIRKLFAQEPEARAHGYSPGFFSFNVEGGRCPACKGEGYQKVEMYFFEDLYVRCEDCGGTRYRPEALSVHYGGKTIAEVLEMTVDEAYAVFSNVPAAQARLNLLREVGLGYLRLGQPATTLSGGEAQRLKICAELTTGTVSGVLFILDEPTVGLHPLDVRSLMDVLGRLVAAGNTVLLIEHNMDVIAGADWVIDIGPEGGDAGGFIICAGRPEDVAATPGSHTGDYLRKSTIRTQKERP